MADELNLSDRLEALYRDLITPNGGAGPSTTKLVWLHAGLASVYCAVVSTLAGVSVYVFLGRADSVYWLAAGALWTAALGFASQVLRGQHRAAKEIALGTQPSPGSGGSQ